MNRSLMVLLTVLSFSQPLWADPSPPADSPPAAPEVQHAPRLVCDQPEFDFGTLDNSQTVDHEFVLRNEGDLTLEIANARPSCGCTVASISNRSVPPGGECRIAARLNLAGRLGPQHKVITVDSNDPQKPQYALTLKGTAVAAIDVQPPRLLLPNEQVGSQPTGTLTIAGQPGQPFTITSVEANTDKLRALVETVETGRLYKVSVFPTHPLEAAPLEGLLFIKTDHPQRPVVEVPVTVLVHTALVVAPRELVFPVASSNPVSRYIIVRNTGNQPFQLTSVETPSPDITSAVTPFGPNGYRIQISNLRPQPDLNGKVIRLHASLPDQQPLEVPIHVYEAAPTASPAPAAP